MCRSRLLVGLLLTLVMSALPAAALAEGPPAANNSAAAVSNPGADELIAQAARKEVAEAANEEATTTPAQELSQEAQPPAKPARCPPLPLHNIEGAGGTPLVPMAYMVNPGPPGTIVGLPSPSFTFLRAASKDLEILSITETFLRRIEIGYSIGRFGLGTVPDAIKKATGAYIDRDDVYLQVINARVQLIEENSFGLPTPAITAGVEPKFNAGMRTINHRLNGALTAVGYEGTQGIDFTLHASKTVPICGMPIIGTVGMRNSKAEQLGYLGFGEDCKTTVEASLVAMVTKWLAVGYEFRQKAGQFQQVPGVLGEENNWQSIFIGLILTDRLTLAGGVAYLGDVGNSTNAIGWALQAKYEF